MRRWSVEELLLQGLRSTCADHGHDVGLVVEEDPDRAEHRLC